METKKCSKCGEEKPLTEFWRNHAAADGLHFWCKGCSRAYGSRWARDNRRYRTQKQLDWQHEHRDEYNARQRALRAARKAVGNV